MLSVAPVSGRPAATNFDETSWTPPETAPPPNPSTRDWENAENRDRVVERLCQGNEIVPRDAVDADSDAQPAVRNPGGRETNVAHRAVDAIRRRHGDVFAVGELLRRAERRRRRPIEQRRRAEAQMTVRRDWNRAEHDRIARGRRVLGARRLLTLRNSGSICKNR